jgi:hypothetical protein
VRNRDRKGAYFYVEASVSGRSPARTVAGVGYSLAVSIVKGARR